MGRCWTLQFSEAILATLTAFAALPLDLGYPGELMMCSYP